MSEDQQVFAVLVFCGVWSAGVASRHGFSPGFWFFAGLALGPIGIAASYVNGRTLGRRCPHCIKAVHRRATRCPHCQGDIAPAPPRRFADLTAAQVAFYCLTGLATLAYLVSSR